MLDKYYQSSGCSEKENILFEDCELGRIVKEIFPDAKRSQRRVNGKKTWHYTLSCASSDSSDSVEWENLPNQTSAEVGWQLTSTTGEYHEWIKVVSQDLRDGNRVLQEIKIFRDWNFTVHVNNKDISKADLGIPNLRASRRLIQRLFNVLNTSSYCGGYEVSAKRITKDVKGNVTGITEEWSTRVGGDVSFHHRSVNCRVILPNDFRSSSRLYCENCAKLKKNCTSKNVIVEGAKPAPKKRESFMSEEELREKLQEEKARRRNAERREKYLREKINEDMKTFGLEDHNDFTHMFHMVEKGSLNEDMKLLWEEQEKALHAKSSKGYRWHPK